MDSNAHRFLAVGGLAVGVVLWLVRSVYPFQYGQFESLVLARLFVAIRFFRFVLDDALVAD
jgi:hypothetical protein